MAELCPDCGRPQLYDGEPEFCCAQLLHANTADRMSCAWNTVAKLRVQLAAVEKLDSAERRVVEASLVERKMCLGAVAGDYQDNGIRTEYWRRRNEAERLELQRRSAVDALLALRAEANHG